MSSDPSKPPSETGAESDGERLVRLALYVKEHPGSDFDRIRSDLPGEYGFCQDGDADRRKRHDAATRRRFERDKASLRDYGVVFSVDGDDRYSLDEQASFAAPVDLTESQASLVRLICSALLEDESYPLKNELRMILAKIGDDIDVPDLLPGLGSGARSDDPHAGRLKKVRKAIAKRKRLSFEYRNAHGGASTREVEPFGCFLLNKNCYVVAHDPSVDDDRVFRLDRMGHVKTNAKSPEIPDFEAREFDPAAYYGLPFQFGSEDYEAQVAFDAASAWRASRLSMGQGELEAPDAGSDGDGDGSVLWTVRVRDTRALVRWCVENGPGIVPVRPAAARDLYEDGLRELLGALDADANADAGEGAR